MNNKCKFSIIMAQYGPITDKNLEFAINLLSEQTFRDFEIIIAGTKILNTPEETVNGITIKNVVIENENSMGKLMNEGIYASNGEYIQLWSGDLITYPDYLEKLNKYIKIFGDDNLYSGRWIDVRGIDKNYTDFLVKSYNVIEGIGCFHRSHFEPYREEFKGYATHYTIELYYRLWKKLTFICLKDLMVIHLPHKNRSSKEQELNSSRNSAILIDKMNRETNERME